MSARPTYSDEFKADAVELVVSSGRSPASVAPELGISVTALKRWVRLSREGQPEGGNRDDPVDPGFGGKGAAGQGGVAGTEDDVVTDRVSGFGTRFGFER
jgi:transposase-like protein